MRITFLIILINLFAYSSIAQSVKTIKVKYKSDSDLIEEVYFVRKKNKNIKEGLFQQIYNDKKITEGSYSDNMKNGIWEFFDYSGKLNFTGNYVDDQKDGEWTYYYNGNLSCKMYYSMGMPDSIFSYFENGIKAYEKRHFDNEVGIAKSYYDNGNLKEFKPLKDGSLMGVYQVYFKNGQLHRETTYEDLTIESVNKSLDMKGNSVDGGNLTNGNGNYIAYFVPDDTNNLQLVYSAFQELNNGVLNGVCRYYHKDGKLKSEGIMENGFSVGEWKYLRIDGSLEKIINYDIPPYSEKKEQGRIENYSDRDVKVGDIMPEFPGGDAERLNYLIRTIRMNEEIRKSIIMLNPGLRQMSEVVYVSFVISETGEVESCKVTHGVNEIVNDEALRVIRGMPRWNPGLVNGIPKSVLFNMPIKFSIQY